MKTTCRLIGIGLLAYAGMAPAKPPQFKQYMIERDCPLVDDSVMSCTLADLDRDGDLDWTVGTVWPKSRKYPNNRFDRVMYWYEYQAPDTWIRHPMGVDPDNYGGACVLDANADGLPDVLAGNLWLNRDNATRWQLCQTGLGDGVHDMVRVDINQDGKTDALVFTQERGLNWMESPADPTGKWTVHSIAPFDYAGAKVHATGAPQGAGDLDGDGDIDVAAVRGWFENTDGNALAWTYRRNDLFPGGTVGAEQDFPWGYAVKTAVRDVDADGDMDIVQTECDTRQMAGIVWLENTDGKGNFTRHWVKPRCSEDYHTLAVIDYDSDGDWDIFSGVGPLGRNAKRAYLFENRSQRGQHPVTWQQHVIHAGMQIHEAITGDVDADGDVDIILKPWNSGPRNFIYLENRIVH